MAYSLEPLVPIKNKSHEGLLRGWTGGGGTGIRWAESGVEGAESGMEGAGSGGRGAGSGGRGGGESRKIGAGIYF